MADKSENVDRGTVGAWTKRCYFAGRAVMDSLLRPYDLGSTQWYVLHLLAGQGPAKQSDLVRLLGIERATMSGLVTTLLRKALVEQLPDPVDQRQKRLRLTPEGQKLWNELPDLTFIHGAAFDGIDEADIAITLRVLQTATRRLDDLLQRGISA